LADTGAANHRTIFQIAKSLLFANVDPSHVGFFQFFGPLVLAFSPLLFRTVRKTPLWRTCLLVWFVAVVGISSSSGMARFQLALFPLALAAVIAAVAQLQVATHPWLRAGSVASVALVLLGGFAGLLIYARNSIKVSLGMSSRENHLREFAPDYQANEFTNNFLRGRPPEGKVMVFNRHVYYLHVPFVYGLPDTNWGIDPSALQTPSQWHGFFAKNGISWVVRSPSFPPELAASLEKLETTGALVPVAQTETQNFRGMRILGVRDRSQLVILHVMDPNAASPASSPPN
jgi:hypothetical protein